MIWIHSRSLGATLPITKKALKHWWGSLPNNRTKANIFGSENIHHKMIFRQPNWNFDAPKASCAFVEWYIYRWVWFISVMFWVISIHELQLYLLSDSWYIVHVSWCIREMTSEWRYEHQQLNFQSVKHFFSYIMLQPGECEKFQKLLQQIMIFNVGFFTRSRKNWFDRSAEV